MLKSPFTGDEIPASKAKRSLSTDFVETSSLPSWLTTTGEATDPTLTFHPLTTERGEAELVSDSDDDYIVGPEFDPTVYEEIRFRISGRSQLSGANYLIMSFADVSGDGASSNMAQLYQQPTSDTATLVVENADTTTDHTVNFDLLTGKPFVLEIRLRPSVNGVDVIANHDQVVYSADGLDYGLANFWPRFRADTRPEGTTESVFLGEYTIEFLHA